MKTWHELKAQGAVHYKTGGVEPIDLYRSAGAFRSFALCSIIKYAYRNIGTEPLICTADLHKIIHYAELLIAEKGKK